MIADVTTVPLLTSDAPVPLLPEDVVPVDVVPVEVVPVLPSG